MELMVAALSRLEARSIAVEVGIEVLDLRTALGAAPECPYQAANMHWTEYGHEVVTDAVARHLATP
jgi:hypothetical protein